GEQVAIQRIQGRIVDIRFEYAFAEIIEYDRAAGATQPAERLFVEFSPRARAGLEGEQANGLAAVAQREHEQTCAAILAAGRIAAHRAAAVIDLSFLGRWRDDDRTRRL